MAVVFSVEYQGQILLQDGDVAKAKIALGEVHTILKGLLEIDSELVGAEVYDKVAFAN